MEYGEAFLKKVSSLGILHYPISMCLNVLDVLDADKEQFAKDFANSQSPVFKAYKKGSDQADYAIDIGLFNKAKEGDIDALNRYEERMAERKENGQ